MPSLQCGKHAFLFPRHTIKFEKSNVIMYFWPRLLNCQTEKVPIQIDFSRTLPNSSKGINYFPKPSTKKLPSLDLKGKCTGLLYYTQHAVFIIVKSTMNSKAGNADVSGCCSSLASVLSSQFLWLLSCWRLPLFASSSYCTFHSDATELISFSASFTLTAVPSPKATNINL